MRSPRARAPPASVRPPLYTERRVGGLPSPGPCCSGETVVDVRILQEHANPLLKRHEYHFEVSHATAATPSREAVRGELSKLVNAPKDRVVIERMNARYGTATTRGEALVYETAEAAKSITRSHILVRNGLKEKAAKGPAPPSAPAPTEAPKPESGASADSKPETKPEPKPEHKPESRPEHKPEPKPEHKPEHKPDHRAGAKSEEKADAEKPEHKPEHKAKPKSEKDESPAKE